MKDGVYLRQVIDVIDEIEFDDVKESHAFGFVYEEILRELQSAGSSGEFYTPRAVTEFMALMIQPKLGEKMADFACGTGGFITSWLGQLSKQVTDTSAQKQLDDSIYGIEKKPFPYLLCVTNMLLHDIEVPNIYHMNSLKHNLLDYTEADKFDVILMNPPYEHWAKIHNLKNASRAYVLYQEMGFDSPEALAAACDAAHAKVDDIRTMMKSVEASIKETKEFRDYVLNYHKTRYVIDELKACKNEKARQKYRDEHDSDFIILNAAKRYFDSKGLKKLPSYKVLQTEVEQLIKEKNELYNQYQTAREEVQRLDTIRHNLEQHLGRKIEHKPEQER